MPADASAAEDLSPLAERVRGALTSGDPDGFRELLAPDARWGDEDTGCRNRDQVVDWWARAQASGVRATVTEVTPGTGALLVGLEVTGRPADAGGVSRRWQVHIVRDGLIASIQGFDNRPEAASQAGLVSR